MPLFRIITDICDNSLSLFSTTLALALTASSFNIVYRHELIYHFNIRLD